MPKTLFNICRFLILFYFFFNISLSVTEASWSKISNTPILTVGPENSWDQSKVGSASIIFDGSIFKMWYEGNGGSTWRIGFSTSADGINWVKNSTFVVDKLDNFANANVHDPKVIFKNSTYKMWFSGSNPSIKDIHINYSESPDGIFWNQVTLNIIPVSLTWEDDTGISFPYTIFLNNEYKMWYAARGHLNGITRWRIGYATSADGISWTKNPTPVLEASQAWEGVDVGNPSVIFENGIYEMFYHGDFGIGRATSPDGINWTKDPTNPILIPTAGTFDARRVFNPYVLKKDGIFYMYYTGIGSDDKWQIGLATSEAIPTPIPTVTPSITSIPTPSPTPTITITPTLTPTPSPTISQQAPPIIFIPGLGASWNPKDIFSCSIDASGRWEMAPYITIYNRLIKTLTDNARLAINQDFYVYTYDWRQTLPKQAENFKKYVDNILIAKPPETKVRLVGHSLGGLVIRSYLDTYPTNHHVLSAMTIGTPHMGAVDAYPIWEKGEIVNDDLLLQIAMNQVVTNCKVIRSIIFPNKSVPIMKFRNNRDIVQYLVPVIKQLLPTFDYLRQNNLLKSTSNLKNQNDWIPYHPFPTDNYNTSFYTLSGENIATLRFLDVVNPTIRESVFGDWLDGRPIGNEKVMAGDKTVLNLSSILNSATNETITGDHGDIVASAQAIQKILHFLGLDGVSPAPAEVIPEEISENALTISLALDAQIKITDPRGKVLEAKENIFVSFNPAVGLYRLEIISNKSSASFLHLSQIEKGKEAIENSYPLTLIKNRSSRFYLIYNPNNSNPLKLIPL